MKDQIRTVVIDDNNEAVTALTRELGSADNITVVKTFLDGEEAVNYLTCKSDDYDVVIMDLIIPKIDGIEILERLNSAKIDKKIIITSSYKDDILISKCCDLGVDYYMLKPFNIEVLVKRINDIWKSSANFINAKNNIDSSISDLLHNLGIPSHIRGFKYIREGINILYNTSEITMITKDIYPQIAEKFDTTPSRVERAIRHAIEVSWIRGDLALMEEIFGFSVSCDKAKPTNSEFLSTIADKLKVENL